MEIGLKSSTIDDSLPVNESLIRDLVDNLLHLMSTWLDLRFVVGYHVRLLFTPKFPHWTITKCQRTANFMLMSPDQSIHVMTKLFGHILFVKFWDKLGVVSGLVINRGC